MRCVHSLLRVVVPVIALLPVTIQAAVLELGLDPELGMREPFKPKQDIAFRIKNNAPKDFKLEVTVSGGTHTGCDTVLKDSTCELTVTPDDFGLMRVSAKSANGRYIAINTDPGNGVYSVAYRFASFNLSFDRTCSEDCSTDNSVTPAVQVQCKKIKTCESGFDILKREMALGRDRQQELIDKFNGAGGLTPEEEALAKAAIQIRNVAEIIQRVNPDVFVLAEFDNDGEGKEDEALEGFQKHYLSEPQKAFLQGLEYPNTYNAGTNTGELSGHDLNHDNRKDGPDDAWGHGYYHGQYTFAVFGKEPYTFESAKTFRKFKWKDMPGQKNPKLTECDKWVPDGLQCPGDKWYSDDAWEEMRLSSKNHVDLPVKITDLTEAGHTVHFLVSHPTPPVFDHSAKHNYWRNSAEIEFWLDYINGDSYFVDDCAVGGGQPRSSNEHFIIAGDLNADPDYGDGHRTTVQQLLNSPLVNTEATIGSLKPTSKGAVDYVRTSGCKSCNRDKNNDTVTSSFGLRADYVIPSKTLKVLRSGVFWPAAGEDGRYLVYDEKLGEAKGVSSDHRMVWVDLYPSAKSSGKTGL